MQSVRGATRTGSAERLLGTGAAWTIIRYECAAVQQDLPAACVLLSAYQRSSWYIKMHAGSGRSLQKVLGVRAKCGALQQDLATADWGTLAGLSDAAWNIRYECEAVQ